MASDHRDDVDRQFRDPEWREVLCAAALIDDLTVAAMSAAASVSPELAMRVFDDAVAARVIRHRQLDPDLAATLVDGLSPERYTAIHAAGARYFAQGGTDDQCKAITLARRGAGVISHDEQVGIMDAAAGALLTDGRFAESVELYAEADGLDPDRSSLRRAHRLAQWAQAAEYTGDTTTAAAQRLRGFDLAEAAGDAALMTTIAVDYSTPPGWRFGDDNAARMVSRAEKVATDDRDRARLAAVRAMLSMRVPSDPAAVNQAGWVTQSSVAQPLADRALVLANGTDDRAELLALLAWRTTHTGPSWLAQRRDTSQEAVELAQAVGHPDWLVQACAWAAVDAIESGDVNALDRTITIARWAAERSGIPRALWYAHTMQASRAFMADDLAEASAHKDAALDIGQRASLPGTLSGELMMFAQLVISRDNPDEIAAVCMPADHPMLAGLMGRTLNAVGLARINRTDEARRDLTMALRWVEDETSMLFVGALAAHAAALIGDHDVMRHLVTKLSPWSHHMAVDSSGWWCAGPVSLALAELHHALGDDDAARPLVAEAAYGAERLHDVRSLRRAQTLWADIGTSASATASPTRSAALARLSERELVVLQLVAQGHTNPEIAEQLAYSMATVRRDTISIYRKLGVHGRVEATAVAIAEGLVGADPSRLLDQPSDNATSRW
jgi:DNA-binding CsgD family transcriptional regulator